jgi:hypothetical protein
MIAPETDRMVEKTVQLLCRDLLMAPTYTFSWSGIAVIMSIQIIIVMVILVKEHKNPINVSLTIADAMYVVYMLIMFASDLQYKGRFYFYTNMWNSSIQCYVAMVAFFLSFQQSLVSLLLSSCQVCVLIAFPFEKKLHFRLVHAMSVTWLVVVMELGIVTSLININGYIVSASNQFCQDLKLSENVAMPISASLLVLFGFLILCYCASVGGLVILVNKSNRSVSTSMGKATTRRANRMKKMVVRYGVALMVNIMSLSVTLATSTLSIYGIVIGDNTLLILTITVMSLSKLCNPWIFTFQQCISK